MIYLRTGANGSGKTLLTLRDVREKSLAESRPVYHNGRFDLVADFGWHKIDFKDWQAQPDGGIFIVDECHNDMPVRSGKDPAPEYIRMLAEHRRRGFDFYLITQHPLNIDAFVRRLIGSPGWHQHLKRASGAALVSVTEFNTVNEICQKAGANASGSMKLVPYPKEVYKWYNSTSLDTAKLKIPLMFKVLVASVLLVPVVIWAGWKSFQSANLAPKTPPALTASGGPAAAPRGGSAAPAGPVSVADYVQSYTPRLAGLAYTAPRYDELTKPTQVPFPAACVKMGEKCQCYTQQATKLNVGEEICLSIVKDGYYQDWQTGPAAGAQPVPQSLPQKTNGAT